MITLQAVHDTILGATHLANDRYITMSGGASIHDNGVESLISSTIARKLWCKSNNRREIPSKLADGAYYSITLESPFHHVAVDSGSEKRGRKDARFTESERIDVTFWSKDGYPIGVIEVKRHFGFAQAQSDLERITFLIKRHGQIHGGSVRWGAIAGMRTVWGANPKHPSEILGDVCSKIADNYNDVVIKKRGFKSTRLEKPKDYDGELFLGYDAYVILLTGESR